MDMQIFLVIFGCTIVSTLVPFSFGLIGFNRNPFYLKLLFALTGVSLICDIASFFLPYLKINPNYVGNTYRLVEFAILLTIYYHAFNNRKMLILFLSIGLLYISLFTMNLVFLQQEKINSYTETFSALVFISLSVTLFYRLMKDLPTLQIHRLPMFWINTAVLIYFAGNLFVFILTNYLVSILKNDLAVYWTFHNLLSITKNLLFAIALWQNLRTPKLL